MNLNRYRVNIRYNPFSASHNAIDYSNYPIASNPAGFKTQNHDRQAARIDLS
jgi:hypothetical protein